MNYLRGKKIPYYSADYNSILLALEKIFMAKIIFLVLYITKVSNCFCLRTTGKDKFKVRSGTFQGPLMLDESLTPSRTFPRLLTYHPTGVTLMDRQRVRSTRGARAPLSSFFSFALMMMIAMTKALPFPWRGVMQPCPGSFQQPSPHHPSRWSKR